MVLLKLYFNIDCSIVISSFTLWNLYCFLFSKKKQYREDSVLAHINDFVLIILHFTVKWELNLFLFELLLTNTWSHWIIWTSFASYIHASSPEVTQTIVSRPYNVCNVLKLEGFLICFSLWKKSIKYLCLPLFTTDISMFVYLIEIFTSKVY